MPLRRHASAALAVALALASPAALAQPTPEEKAGARAAAEKGGDEFKAGHYKDALDLFLRAESLIHAPTHLLMIARTHAALGELVVAKETYLKITREDLPATAPGAFKRAHADAEKELKDLDPRIPAIQVSVSNAAGAKNLAVVMDGKPVPAALVGIPRPVDPGAHVFRATADGLESADKPISAKEGDKLSVTLELKPARQAAKPPPGDAPGPVAAAPGEPPPAQPPADEGPKPPSSINGPRVASFVMMGVGSAGLGVGIGMGILSLKKRGEANDAFDKCGAGCHDAPAAAVRALDSDANTKGTISVIGLVAGGALAIGGAVLFVVSRPKPSAGAAEVRVGPWIGAGSAGVVGRF
jgi:hypothetical protein